MCHDKMCCGPASWYSLSQKSWLALMVAPSAINQRFTKKISVLVIDADSMRYVSIIRSMNRLIVNPVAVSNFAGCDSSISIVPGGGKVIAHERSTCLLVDRYASLLDIAPTTDKYKIELNVVEASRIKILLSFPQYGFGKWPVSNICLANTCIFVYAVSCMEFGLEIAILISASAAEVIHKFGMLSRSSYLLTTYVQKVSQICNNELKWVNVLPWWLFSETIKIFRLFKVKFRRWSTDGTPHQS